ncbi:MAG TPA: pitrilysin family protein [Planktothrix sp.]|jgi:predicted Zn-dependent peptidase
MHSDKSMKKATTGALSMALALSFLPVQLPVMAQTKPATPTQAKGSQLNTVDIRKKDADLPAKENVAPAQAPSAVEVFRKNAPNVPAPRPFNLPTVDSYKLDNGLKVELVSDSRFPFVTTALAIKAGSALEGQEKLGLADMTADMLVEGTKDKSSKQIADEVDFIGGALRASSDYDYTILSGSSLSKYTDRLFKVFADTLFNPTFPEDELTLKKTNLIQSLSMRRSEPGFLAEERFHKVIFGNHPYSVVAPTPATVHAITRDDLQKFHDEHYLPNESVLVVVGDFDKAKMKETIASEFSAWKSGTMPVVQQAQVPAQHGRKIYLVNRPGSVQSSIRVGNLSVDRKDPNFFPMLVANQILGGAAGARLFLNIREQKGFTYGAYSNMGALKQPGAFVAEADVRTDVTAASLEEFLYELDRLRNIKPSDKELKNAKNYLAGSFQLGLETQAGLAQRLLDVDVYELPSDYLQTYADKITAVSADDVRRVARKMVDYDNIVIAVVGDAKKIEKDLEFFAPVEVYDTTGALSTDWQNQNSGG